MGNNRKPLPKLPYGQGTLVYVTQKGKEYVQYKKKVCGKRITVYGKSAKECMELMKEKEKALEEEMRNKEEALSSGISLEERNATVYDAIHYYLKTFKFNKIKAKSYDTLESTLNSQIKGSIIGNKKVTEVTKSDIQETLNSIQAELSYSTTKKTYLLLNQYFNYFYTTAPLSNPMAKIPSPKEQTVFTVNDEGRVVKAKPLIVLSDDEITLLTKELTKEYVPYRKGYRHGYGIIFIMWMFCRLGEALALQWRDVDFEKRTVNIYKEYEKVDVRDKNGEKIMVRRERDGKLMGKKEWILTTPKSDAGVRNNRVCKKAINALTKYKEVQRLYREVSDNDFIFRSEYDNPLADQNLNDDLHAALKRAGIKTKVSIHGLRHTGISYFIRHGVSDKVVAELAGHSDVAITDKIYYDLIEEQKNNAIDSIDALDDEDI